MKSILRPAAFQITCAIVALATFNAFAFDVPTDIPKNLPADVKLDPVECGGVPKIDIDPDSQSPLKVQEVFNNLDSPQKVQKLADQGINTFISSIDGKYHVCFDFKKINDSQVKSEKVSDPISLIADKDKDIVIEGLRLKRDPALSEGKPLLHVQNNGKGKITISDLVMIDVKDGLFVEAPPASQGTRSKGGDVIIVNSKFMGQLPSSEEEWCGQNEASDFSNCLNMNSAGFIEGSLFEQCEVAIKAEVPQIIVKNSEIKNNKIGVWGKDGIILKHNKIYANDDCNPETDGRYDAITIDPIILSVFGKLIPGRVRDIDFYELVKDESGAATANELGIDESGLIAFKEGADVYIVLNEDVGPGDSIELFYTSANECVGYLFANGQACDYVPDGIIHLDADEMNENGSQKVKIPIEKDMVAIFTSAERGSTALSLPFTGKPPIVAIVNTPYDIPTSPATQDTGDSGDGSGAPGGNPGGYIPGGETTVGSHDFQGGDFEFDPTNLPESGDDDIHGGNKADGDPTGGNPLVSPLSGAGTGCSRGASIIAADHATALSWGLGLWWIIFALGLVASLRVAVMRIRR